MATTQLGTSYRISAKVKYSDNGTIKSGSRTIGFTELNKKDYFDDPEQVSVLVTKFQGLITDTITSYEIIETKEYTGDFGSAGSISPEWDHFEDIKLINEYTDGDKTYRETIKRVATSKDDSYLRGYARELADLDGLSAVNGNYTGSTVTSAWTMD